MRTDIQKEEKYKLIDSNERSEGVFLLKELQF